VDTPAIEDCRASDLDFTNVIVPNPVLEQKLWAEANGQPFTFTDALPGIGSRHGIPDFGVPRVVFVASGHNVETERVPVSVLKRANLARSCHYHEAARYGIRLGKNCFRTHRARAIHRQSSFLLPLANPEIGACDAVWRLEPGRQRRNPAEQNLVVMNGLLGHYCASPLVLRLPDDFDISLTFHE
jgi:hypothetical protein